MLNWKLLLIIILTVFVSCESSDIHNIRTREKNIQLSGKVIDKYIDGVRMNARMIVMSNSNIEKLYMLDLYDSLNVGDSIFKFKGELNYTIIRKSDTIIYWPKTLNYIIKLDTLIPY